MSATTVAETSVGTTAGLPASASTVGTSASAAGQSPQLGLCLTNPTASSSTLSYGTSAKAAFLAAAPVFFAGAAIAGIALLSYAITKAAIEP